MTRDNFSLSTTRRLAQRAAYICSNPSCRRLTIAPALTNDEDFVYIGKAAHICAAAPGGPRYDPEMSADERRAIKNAIFLCGGCADIIDKNGGNDYPVEIIAEWKLTHEEWVKSNLNKANESGRGGSGGSAIVKENYGVVYSGRGGKGGVGGNGGEGGSLYVNVNRGIAAAGDGGDAASADGRGGRRTRAQFEQFGTALSWWGYGYGGCGGNDPEYNRRLQLIIQLRQLYCEKFPDDKVFIDAGIDIVPIDFINQGLVEFGETWAVEFGEYGYVLPPLILK